MNTSSNKVLVWVYNNWLLSYSPWCRNYMYRPSSGKCPDSTTPAEFFHRILTVSRSAWTDGFVGHTGQLLLWLLVFGGTSLGSEVPKRATTFESESTQAMLKRRLRDPQNWCTTLDHVCDNPLAYVIYAQISCSVVKNKHNMRELVVTCSTRVSSLIQSSASVFQEFTASWCNTFLFGLRIVSCKQMFFTVAIHERKMSIILYSFAGWNPCVHSETSHISICSPAQFLSVFHTRLFWTAWWTFSGIPVYSLTLADLLSLLLVDMQRRQRY